MYFLLFIFFGSKSRNFELIELSLGIVFFFSKIGTAHNAFEFRFGPMVTTNICQYQKFRKFQNLWSHYVCFDKIFRNSYVKFGVD